MARKSTTLSEGVNAASLLVIILVSWAIFAVLGSGFLSSFNLYSVGQIASRDVVLGLAQLLFLAVGRLNLAVGSIGAICCSLLGYLLVDTKLGLPVALVLVALLGVGASLVMAVLELVTRLSSFIVTLAFLSIYGGAALLLTGNAQYQITSAALTKLGNGTLWASWCCPLAVLAVMSAAVIWSVYNRTSIGWKMLSVGASERAARASGVNVGRTLLFAYGASGLLCALAAVMQSAYQLNVNGGVGSDWLVPSFIAPVLGGALLNGGNAPVTGLLLAAVFYDSLQSGLTILNVPSYWLQLAEGLVLLAAVLLNNVRNNGTLKDRLMVRRRAPRLRAGAPA